MDFDGVAVQQVGFVFPLFHGVYGGLDEERLAADDFYFGDVSGLPDRGLQLNGSLGAHAESGGGIRRLDLFQQQTLGNSLRNGECLKDGFGVVLPCGDIG